MGVEYSTFGARTIRIWRPKVVQSAPQMAAEVVQSAPYRLLMLCSSVIDCFYYFEFMVLTSAQLFGRQMLNFLIDKHSHSPFK